MLNDVGVNMHRASAHACLYFFFLSMEMKLCIRAYRRKTFNQLFWDKHCTPVPWTTSIHIYIHISYRVHTQRTCVSVNVRTCVVWVLESVMEDAHQSWTGAVRSQPIQQPTEFAHVAHHNLLGNIHLLVIFMCAMIHTYVIYTLYINSLHSVFQKTLYSNIRKHRAIFSTARFPENAFRDNLENHLLRVIYARLRVRAQKHQQQQRHWHNIHKHSEANFSFACLVYCRRMQHSSCCSRDTP